MNDSQVDVVLISRDAQLAEQVRRQRAGGASLLCLTPDELRARPAPCAAQWWIDLDSAAELAPLATGKRVYFYSRVPLTADAFPPGHFVRKPCPGPLLAVLWAGLAQAVAPPRGGASLPDAAPVAPPPDADLQSRAHPAKPTPVAHRAAAPVVDGRLPAWILDFHGLNLRELTDRVVRTLPVRLGATYASLYLPTPRGDTLSLAESSYPSPVELIVPLAETPAHPIAAALLADEAIRTPDVLALCRERGWATPRWSGQTRIIPLRARGERAGVLVLIGAGLRSGFEPMDAASQPAAAESPQSDELPVAEFIARSLRLAQLYELARTEARTDPLTGLLNARSLSEQLEREIVRSTRYGTPLALIAVDLDGLKQHNDEYGHPAGDALLRHVAGRLRAALRQIDVAARVGGDEFLALLPATDVPGARHVADRIDAAVRENAPTIAGVERPITVSVGAAQWQPGWSAADLTAAADRAMYAAKRAARERATNSAPG